MININPAGTSSRRYSATLFPHHKPRHPAFSSFPKEYVQVFYPGENGILNFISGGGVLIFDQVRKSSSSRVKVQSNNELAVQQGKGVTSINTEILEQEDKGEGIHPVAE